MLDLTGTKFDVRHPLINYDIHEIIQNHTRYQYYVFNGNEIFEIHHYFFLVMNEW